MKNMKIIAILSGVFFMIVGFQNCSDVAFDDLNETLTVQDLSPSEVSGLGDGVGCHSESNDPACLEAMGGNSNTGDDTQGDNGSATTPRGPAGQGGPGNENSGESDSDGDSGEGSGDGSNSDGNSGEGSGDGSNSDGDSGEGSGDDSGNNSGSDNSSDGSNDNHSDDSSDNGSNDSGSDDSSDSSSDSHSGADRGPKNYICIVNSEKSSGKCSALAAKSDVLSVENSRSSVVCMTKKACNSMLAKLFPEGENSNSHFKYSAGPKFFGGCKGKNSNFTHKTLDMLNSMPTEI